MQIHLIFNFLFDTHLKKGVVLRNTEWMTLIIFSKLINNDTYNNDRFSYDTEGNLKMCFFIIYVFCMLEKNADILGWKVKYSTCATKQQQLAFIFLLEFSANDYFLNDEWISMHEYLLLKLHFRNIDDTITLT